MKWVAFFSQTGSEIVNISRAINRWPDLVVTNKQNDKTTHVELVKRVRLENTKLITLPKWPKEIDYLKAADKLGFSILREEWMNEVLITLHGYLRILPPDFTKSSTIYNGHPGLITKHPELKGMDPQKKAWSENHIRAGCVIHKVIPELDSGEVVAEKMIHNNFETFIDFVDALHVASSELWINFLNERLRYNQTGSRARVS
jgi:folate-dependent phosphoribosylglycinamide formyltransferase PurN